MIPNTRYTTWVLVMEYNDCPASAILDAINGGDAEWQERMESSGALGQIESEWVNQINEALPDRVNLCGSEFLGPVTGVDISGYPDDGDGGLDIRSIVEAIDLMAIVERHDVDLQS